uniref:AAA+ ATPase domain-containing protein n=1 Tax=viral metagenome TaxID=1070528 RepID=A0A6C0AHE6_9ZZZZ
MIASVVDTILNRKDEERLFSVFMAEFNKLDDKSKKCIYIYGPSGCGKTTFAKNMLKKLDYDVISYDAGDTRNKGIVDNLNVSNMSDQNVLSSFMHKKAKIAILMDEIDCMNNGDKGGINSLIKLIRPKKTKRQQSEHITHVPIVCIGNISQDKKIKEMMKYCLVIELKLPTPQQTKLLLEQLVPPYAHIAPQVHDLKKIHQLIQLNRHNFKGDVQSMLYTNVHEDTKCLTKRIMNASNRFNEHITINDTDRTILALLWHENIIDVLQKMPQKTCIGLYTVLLREVCFADYIDRITFQKQLWLFNEMSFLLKMFYTNYLFQSVNREKYKVSDIRFTKILTKYSTEYNNTSFIQKMCSELSMDKSDVFSYMQMLKTTHTEPQIAQLFEHTEITLLDVQRFYRYIHKCT